MAPLDQYLIDRDAEIALEGEPPPPKPSPATLMFGMDAQRIRPVTAPSPLLRRYIREGNLFRNNAADGLGLSTFDMVFTPIS